MSAPDLRASALLFFTLPSLLIVLPRTRTASFVVLRRPSMCLEAATVCSRNMDRN